MDYCLICTKPTTFNSDPGPNTNFRSTSSTTTSIGATANSGSGSSSCYGNFGHSSGQSQGQCRREFTNPENTPFSAVTTPKKLSTVSQLDNFKESVTKFCSVFDLAESTFSNGFLEPSVSVCEGCHQRIELIASVFSHIEKLQSQLNQLKKCVQNDLENTTPARKTTEKTIIETLKVNSNSTQTQLKPPFVPEEFRDKLRQKLLPSYNSSEEINIDLPNSGNSESSSDDSDGSESDDEAQAKTSRKISPVKKTEARNLDAINSPTKPTQSRSIVTKNKSSGTSTTTSTPTLTTAVAPTESSDSDSDSDSKSDLNSNFGFDKDVDGMDIDDSDPKARIKRAYAEQLKVELNKIPCSFIDPVKGPCSLKFVDQERLDAHIKRCHLKIKLWQIYKCKFCKVTRGSKKKIEDHEKIHTGVKDVTCELCGLSVRNENCLILHKRKEHGEAFPFTCETCGKGFHSSYYLNHHLKQHMGVREFLCDICSKSFQYKHCLERHRRLHTDERPFLCQECGEGFYRRENLQRHMKSHPNPANTYETFPNFE